MTSPSQPNPSGGRRGPFSSQRTTPKWQSAAQTITSGTQMYVNLLLKPATATLCCAGDAWLARTMRSPRLTRHARISRKFTGRRNAGRHIAIRATNGKLYVGARGPGIPGVCVEGFLSTGSSFLYDEGGHLRRSKDLRLD